MSKHHRDCQRIQPSGHTNWSAPPRRRASICCLSTSSPPRRLLHNTVDATIRLGYECLGLYCVGSRVDDHIAKLNRAGKIYPILSRCIIAGTSRVPTTLLCDSNCAPRFSPAPMGQEGRQHVAEMGMRVRTAPYSSTIAIHRLG